MENLIESREYLLLQLREMLRDESIDFSSIRELLLIAEKLEVYMFPLDQKKNNNDFTADDIPF